jgi:hypothetical protein
MGKCNSQLVSFSPVFQTVVKAMPFHPPPLCHQYNCHFVVDLTLLSLNIIAQTNLDSEYIIIQPLQPEYFEYHLYKIRNLKASFAHYVIRTLKRLPSPVSKPDSDKKASVYFFKLHLIMFV